jgi:formylglycine-generating enzyme required for sulfatase activity
LGGSSSIYTTLSGASNPALAWPPTNEMFADMTYTITLTGNGETITLNANGGGTITATVSAGHWNVKVDASYQGQPYATGSSGVNVIAGRNNTVSITMTRVGGDGGGQMFTITTQNDGNGTATAAPNQASQGTLVTISATPSAGYRFKEWQVIAGGVTLSNITETHATFTMPSNPVTIRAAFEELPPGIPYLSLSSVTFDSATFGYAQQAPQTVTITNTSLDAAANVSNITLSGTNAGSFTLSGHGDITTIAANSSATFTVQPNHGLNAGTYTATINVNYNGANYPAATSVSFTVNQADPVVTWPIGLTAAVRQTLSNITLPGNDTSSTAGTFTWVTSTASVGNVGTHQHNMRFTPNDTGNFNTLTHTVSIDVSSGITSAEDIEMVWIPAGTFWMGSSDITGHEVYDQYSRPGERPPRQVTLDGFFMSIHQVTQELYEEITGNNPSSFNGNPMPVQNVTWYDAIEFCNKLSEIEGLIPYYNITSRTPASDYPITALTFTVNPAANGYRLPTEAQWEYACRAGTTTAWNTGNVIIDDIGWYDPISGGTTHPVGEKPENAWGLFDMHGNVWEWCWDWYGNYPSEAQNNPTGPATGTHRVMRGGSWSYSADDARSAFRSSNPPDHEYSNFGFRIVRP